MQPGQQQPQYFNRYQLHQLLGEGSFARVYRAAFLLPDGRTQEVALKLLRSDAPGVDDPMGEAIRDLLNEASLLMRLNHPNVVRIRSVGREGETVFMEMELVEGVGMNSLLRRAAKRQVRIPREATIDMAMQVARGVGYLHRAKDERSQPLRLIHRDLKPGNIRVTHQGVIKILDFGLAKARGLVDEKTSAGVLRGTARFMSPEQVRGDELTPGSDVFAVGAILYELRTGRPLFKADNPLAILHQVQTCQTGAQLKRLEALDPELAPIVARCLSPGVERRFSDGQEVANTLATLIQDGGREASLQLLHDLELTGDGARSRSTGGSSLFDRASDDSADGRVGETVSMDHLSTGGRRPQMTGMRGQRYSPGGGAPSGSFSARGAPSGSFSTRGGGSDSFRTGPGGSSDSFRARAGAAAGSSGSFSSRSLSQPSMPRVRSGQPRRRNPGARLAPTAADSPWLVKPSSGEAPANAPSSGAGLTSKTIVLIVAAAIVLAVIVTLGIVVATRAPRTRDPGNPEPVRTTPPPPVEPATEPPAAIPDPVAPPSENPVGVAPTTGPDGLPLASADGTPGAAGDPAAGDPAAADPATADPAATDVAAADPAAPDPAATEPAVAEPAVVEPTPAPTPTETAPPPAPRLSVDAPARVIGSNPLAIELTIQGSQRYQVTLFHRNPGGEDWASQSLGTHGAGTVNGSVVFAPEAPGERDGAYYLRVTEAGSGRTFFAGSRANPRGVRVY